MIELGTRRRRVRGLEKVTSFDALRVHLLVTRTERPRLAPDAPAGFHVDTLDPYSARAGAVFIAVAAAELRFDNMPPGHVSVTGVRGAESGLVDAAGLLDLAAL